ncbi:hypothetical protein AMS68_005902 [Peltaster fructicola]|uniref:Uncharacterized protein n=1 Tax=Peltaster fructicola TaxID=286661 RepID=A0A6H0Y0E3_9PEZI|nr:hypothetical protein AMS68_005902 [Peltaster fructicola]
MKTISDESSAKNAKEEKVKEKVSDNTAGSLSHFSKELQDQVRLKARCSAWNDRKSLKELESAHVQQQVKNKKEEKKQKQHEKHTHKGSKHSGLRKIVESAQESLADSASLRQLEEASEQAPLQGMRSVKRQHESPAKTSTKRTKHGPYAHMASYEDSVAAIQRRISMLLNEPTIRPSSASTLHSSEESDKPSISPFSTRLAEARRLNARAEALVQSLAPDQDIPLDAVQLPTCKSQKIDGSLSSQHSHMQHPKNLSESVEDAAITKLASSHDAKTLSTRSIKSHNSVVHDTQNLDNLGKARSECDDLMQKESPNKQSTRAALSSPDCSVINLPTRSVSLDSAPRLPLTTDSLAELQRSLLSMSLDTRILLHSAISNSVQNEYSVTASQLASRSCSIPEQVANQRSVKEAGDLNDDDKTRGDSIRESATDVDRAAGTENEEEGQEDDQPAVVTVGADNLEYDDQSPASSAGDENPSDYDDGAGMSAGDEILQTMDQTTGVSAISSSAGSEELSPGNDDLKDSLVNSQASGVVQIEDMSAAVPAYTDDKQVKDDLAGSGFSDDAQRENKSAFVEADPNGDHSSPGSIDEGWEVIEAAKR